MSRNEIQVLSISPNLCNGGLEGAESVLNFGEAGQNVEQQLREVCKLEVISRSDLERRAVATRLHR